MTSLIDYIVATQNVKITVYSSSTCLGALYTRSTLVTQLTYMHVCLRESITLQNLLLCFSLNFLPILCLILCFSEMYYAFILCYFFFVQKYSSNKLNVNKEELYQLQNANNGNGLKMECFQSY